MKYLSHLPLYLFLLITLTFGNLIGQSENRTTKGDPVARNPRWTVIIDYIDSFEHHRPGHAGGPGGGGEEPPPPDPNIHPDGHFELIGGVWADRNSNTAVVDPLLDFIVDVRGFPEGSDLALTDAFGAWDLETNGDLVGSLFFENVDVDFGDGVNTYSMRNLGGGGVLASTFITWNDINPPNNEIDPGEEFLEMDIVHNSTVKWAISASPPKGRWWDVQNVATHEVGHALGLAHPGSLDEFDKEQTMFASAPSKETKKVTLETDGDVPGIQSPVLGYH